ncbi:MAG TPA: hypothetical protein VJN32_05215 [Dehalococcoidia bacterium]|nr:hypothetical protein [Dehalococcoidia bacterium]
MSQHDRGDRTGGNDPRVDKRRFRGSGATFGSYVGLGLGFLFQLSVSSEMPDQFHRDQALLFVIAMTLGGYIAGWLLGPVIARLLGET